MVTMLVPMLFSIIEFGGLFQRWLAQESATIQVARYAAEVGGDTPEVRALFADTLRSTGASAADAILDIAPSRVGWRQPLTVTVRSTAPIQIPFLFGADIPLRTTAVVRGELDR